MSVGDVADGRRDAVEDYGGMGARTEPGDRLWDLVEGQASADIGARGALDDLDDLEDQDDQEQLDGFEESGEERDGADEYGTEFDDYQP